MRKKTTKSIIAFLCITLLLSSLSGVFCAYAEEKAATTDSASDSGKVTADQYEAALSGVEDEKPGFSIWDILRTPLGYVLDFCYTLVNNYAVALLLFALLLKLLLYPLGIKQQKNSVHQASFRPKEMAIRKKYEGRTDKVTQQKMQQEILSAQQDANINVFAGCLPMLIQLPILLSLYQVIRNPLRYMCHLGGGLIEKLQIKVCELYSSGALNIDNTKIAAKLDTIIKAIDKTDGAAASIRSAAGRVDTLDLVTIIRNNFNSFKDLFSNTRITGAGKLPDFSLFGKIDLSVTPDFWNWQLIILVLTFVSVYLSMKLTRKMSYQPVQTGDAGMSMKIMDYMMPLVSTYFAYVWPAVMGLYWIYQNLLGILQQYILMKAYPLPVFTEEDYRKAEREVGGKIPKKPKNPEFTERDPNKPKVKSLHHIDDDDYDIPAVPAKPVNGSPKQGEKNTGSSLIGRADLKDGGNKKDEPEDDNGTGGEA